MARPYELRVDDPSRLPEAGPRALFGGGLIDALRLRGRRRRATARSRATSCILIWMDGGPSHYETFDPKPDAPAEIRGEVRADRDQGPGRPLLAAHDPAGHRGRQGGDRPLDPPRPGEPRRRQPLHDDGGAAAHPGRLRRVRQLPSRAWARSPPASERGASNGLPAYFSIPSMSRSGGRTSSGRSTPPSSSPTTRTMPASGCATSLPRAAWRTRGSTTAASLRAASTASGGSPTRRRATRSWRSTNIMSRGTT